MWLVLVARSYSISRVTKGEKPSPAKDAIINSNSRNDSGSKLGRRHHLISWLQENGNIKVKEKNFLPSFRVLRPTRYSLIRVPILWT